MMSFDKLVKKLLKRGKSVVDFGDLADLAAPGVRELSSAQRSATHKLAYRLKSAGVLVSVRRGLWTVVPPSSAAASRAAPSGDELYWEMLAKAASAACGPRWVLGGRKALELHLRDLSAPDEARLLTAGPSGTVSLSPGKKARLVPLKSYGAATTLFSRFSALSSKLSAEGTRVPVVCVEQAFLEYLTGSASGRDGHALARALAKFGPGLRRDVMGRLVEARYIVAANRLKEAAKRLGFPAVHALCLEVVKREGRGCFVSA